MRSLNFLQEFIRKTVNQCIHALTLFSCCNFWQFQRKMNNQDKLDRKFQILNLKLNKDSNSWLKSIIFIKIWSSLIKNYSTKKSTLFHANNVSAFKKESIAFNPFFLNRKNKSKNMRPSFKSLTRIFSTSKFKINDCLLKICSFQGKSNGIWWKSSQVLNQKRKTSESKAWWTLMIFKTII